MMDGNSLVGLQTKMKIPLEFEVWHPKALVGLLNFILRYHPEELRQFLDEYDEMLRGN